MPARGEPCVPASDRIAGLMAEDLRGEPAIDVVALVDALQERGWTQTQIETHLGKAVTQAWMTAHAKAAPQRTDPLDFAGYAAGVRRPAHIKGGGAAVQVEHAAARPPKPGEGDGDEVVYASGCTHPGLPVRRAVPPAGAADRADTKAGAPA